ncbi:MAG: response regulator transcription factor [Herpetosiphon sp.]
MRIMVAEDERKLANLIKRGLDEAGFEADTAYDGDQAWDMLQTQQYDLLVLDVMLPKRDGYELCRALRAAHYHLPILMLTARDTVADRVTGLNSGADDYLIKPFAFCELVARIRALLRRDSLPKDPLLNLVDIEINTISHTVRRAGKPVELTSKEYIILDYFAHNANRVVTRTQLEEHVWAYDFVAVSNIVDVYIGSLRRKLDDFHEPRLFHTIRGVGYMLKVP